MSRLRFGPILSAFVAPVQASVDPSVRLPIKVKRDLTIRIDAVHTDTYPASVVFRPEPHAEGAHPLTKVHIVAVPAGTFPPATPQFTLDARFPRWSVDVSANADGSPVEVEMTGLDDGETYQGVTILEDDAD